MWFRVENKRLAQGHLYELEYATITADGTTRTRQEVKGLNEAKKQAELLTATLNQDVAVYGTDAQGEFKVAVSTVVDGAGNVDDALVKKLYAQSVDQGLTLRQQLLADFDPKVIEGFAQLAAAMGFIANQVKKLPTGDKQTTLAYRTLLQVFAESKQMVVVEFSQSAAHLALFADALSKHANFQTVDGIRGIGLAKQQRIYNSVEPAPVQLEIDGQKQIYRPRSFFIGTAPGAKHRFLIVCQTDEERPYRPVPPTSVAMVTDAEDAQIVANFLADILRNVDPFKNRIVFMGASGFKFSIRTKLEHGHHWQDMVPDPQVRAELDLVQNSVLRRGELQRDGLTIKRGVLISGPPGVGKSVSVEALIQALAGQVTILIPEVMDNVRQIYDLAQALAPTVVVLEDLDLLTTNRADPYGNLRREDPTGQLLGVLSGATAYPDVITVATTNYPEKIDEALSKRAGRFDVHLKVAPPDKERKLAILDLYLAKFGLTGTVADGVRALFTRSLLDLPIVGAHIEQFVEVGVKRGRLGQSGDPTTFDFQPGIEAIKSIAHRKPAA